MNYPKDHTPQHFALHCLRWFCPTHVYEEIEGDLIQKFERDVKTVGEKKAKRKLIWNTIRFFRPGIILRNKFSIELNKYFMIKNYLLTAIRILLRQKTYSFINILGLSIGLASSLFIAIYVLDELSYDRYFTDAEKIYRVGVIEKFQGEEIKYTDSGAPLAEGMRTEIPEVVSTMRIGQFLNYSVRYKEKSFLEKRFILADSNFFEFFNYKLIEGNPEECLKGPNKIIISETTARKYFDYKGKGDRSPLGKSFDLDNGKRIAEVTGILEDVPHNTHLKFDMILSTDSWDYAVSDDCWACYNLKTYFKINETTSLPAVEKKLNAFVEEKVLPRIEKDLSVKKLTERGDAVSFLIQPLTSIHLESHCEGEFEPNGDIRYVSLFGAVAIFIILIACINFMNLATARASGRAKEVGIRKTIGAANGWLVQQFMVESFLYVIISTLLALILVVVTIQPFNLLAAKEFTLDFFKNPYILLAIGCFVLIVGIVSGSYPAFYLSSFNPVRVLKGHLRAGKSGSLPRKILVQHRARRF